MSNKYQREIKPGVNVDVYDVLKAFNVTCPALAHAVKKCLAPGQRAEQDKREAIASIERSIEMEPTPLTVNTVDNGLIAPAVPVAITDKLDSLTLHVKNQLKFLIKKGYDVTITDLHGLAKDLFSLQNIVDGEQITIENIKYVIRKLQEDGWMAEAVKMIRLGGK